MKPQINLLMESVVWAAASGRIQDIEALIAAHEIPQDVRTFGAEVAAAGGHLAVVALLTPTLH